LSLSSSTGLISGIPILAQSTTKYTINATNQNGSSTFILPIKVDLPTIIRTWATFTDMLDGTVKVEVNAGTFGGQTYTARTLYFAKCSHGQTYVSSSNTCTGTASTVQFCTTDNNSCNGGDANNPVSSGTLFNACNNLNSSSNKPGNRTGWRVPSKNELRLVINCKDTTQLPSDNSECTNYNIPTINELFPNTSSYYYWSSTTSLQSYPGQNIEGNAWYVTFNSGYVNNSLQKFNTHHVRCISTQ